MVQKWESDAAAVYELIAKVMQLRLGIDPSEPHRRLQTSSDLAYQGELALAFECVCDNLHQYAVILDKDMLRKIEAVGDLVGVERQRYAYIHELVE